MLGKPAVKAVLDDLETAEIGAPLRATLRFLAKVTKQHAEVTADDIRTLVAAGVTRAQIEDALLVGWSFNVITRLADTFEFEVGPDAAFDSSAKQLLSRGYKL